MALKKANGKGIEKSTLKVLSELKTKMLELKKIEKRIKREESRISPHRTMKLIEEIKVPALEAIKEESKKNHKVH